MGGQAFNKPGPKGEPPIVAARLLPDTYRQLKDRFATVLSAYYEGVVCPLEAPGKSDHGDIDFLVDTPRKQFAMTEMIQSLNAERFSDRGDGYSFAVPFSVTDSKMAYAQLDIHPCHGNLDWLGFMQSYGDLWPILGVTLRPYGLTANDKGFHIRVSEMETRNRKASMLFMSRDPHHVLDFLGLDTSVYEHGFETEEGLFKWISTTRFIDKEAFLERDDTAKDRRRMLIRGMFKRFIQDWVPTLPEKAQSEASLDRKEIAREAASFFGRTEQYEVKVAQAHAEMEEEAVWTCISTLLSPISMSKENLNLVLRAFKRWVKFENRMPSIRNTPEMEGDRQPCFAIMLDDAKDGVKAGMAEWIMRNWEDIKTCEKRRIKEKKEAGVLEQSGYT